MLDQLRLWRQVCAGLRVSAGRRTCADICAVLWTQSTTLVRQELTLELTSHVYVMLLLLLFLHAGLLPFAIGSETWGSVVCPATTVGVTAYRPSGGTIPTNGLLQVC